MRSKGLAQLGAADRRFACHSLGELSALGAVADILPNYPLIDIVFYWGLTMQHAVERDGQVAEAQQPAGLLKTMPCMPSTLAALA
jgi:malonyl CoA-acyl carrier protein transacylase